MLLNVNTSDSQMYRADTGLIFYLWFQQVQLQYANVLKHNLLMVHFKALLLAVLAHLPKSDLFWLTSDRLCPVSSVQVEGFFCDKWIVSKM